MKKFRLRPAVWLASLILIIAIITGVFLNGLIDCFVDNILSQEFDLQHFFEEGDGGQILYGWYHDDTFADGGYYYEHSDEEKQTAYQVLYRAITDRNGETPLGTENRETIMDAYNFITYDHPEIFYTEGYDLTEYTLKNGTTFLTFNVKYSESSKKQEDMEYFIAMYVNSVLESVNSEWSDYEKIKYVYNRIIQETSYDLDGEHAYNIYAVAHDHAGVCEGYAKMFKYLLDRLDIPCIVIPGFIRSTGSNHMWNAVYMDGRWYYIDPTWGDIQFDGNKSTEAIRYDYFCVTYDEIMATHVVDPYIPRPECDTVDENYFVKEGLYFSTITDDHVKMIIDSLTETGMVTFRCSDMDVYEDAYEMFIMQDVIHCTIGFDTKIKYTTNRNVLTFTFWIPDN